MQANQPKENNDGSNKGNTDAELRGGSVLDNRVGAVERTAPQEVMSRERFEKWWGSKEASYGGSLREFTWAAWQASLEAKPSEQDGVQVLRPNDWETVKDLCGYLSFALGYMEKIPDNVRGFKPTIERGKELISRLSLIPSKPVAKPSEWVRCSQELRPEDLEGACMKIAGDEMLGIRGAVRILHSPTWIQLNPKTWQRIKDAVQRDAPPVAEQAKDISQTEITCKDCGGYITYDNQACIMGGICQPIPASPPATGAPRIGFPAMIPAVEPMSDAVPAAHPVAEQPKVCGQVAEIWPEECACELRANHEGSHQKGLRRWNYKPLNGEKEGIVTWLSWNDHLPPAAPKPAVAEPKIPIGGDPKDICANPACGHHEMCHADYADTPRSCNQTGCGCDSYMAPIDPSKISAMFAARRGEPAVAEEGELPPFIEWDKRRQPFEDCALKPKPAGDRPKMHVMTDDYGEKWKCYEAEDANKLFDSLLAENQGLRGVIKLVLPHLNKLPRLDYQHLARICHAVLRETEGLREELKAKSS